MLQNNHILIFSSEILLPQKIIKALKIYRYVSEKNEYNGSKKLMAVKEVFTAMETPLFLM